MRPWIERMSMKRVLLLFWLGSAMSQSWAGEYHLGEGYNAGNINIAGYINMVAEAPRNGKAQLMGDDLSLFVSGRYNKYFNPFFEAEYTGVTLWREGGSLLSDNKPTFVLERLYNDSNLAEDLSLRVGKLLTPVGEWNGIHAAPLVSTTTRPLTTFRSFPEYTSGLDLNYAPQNGRLPEIQLYVQPDGEIMPRPKELVVREYRHVTGVHLNWASGLIDKLGVSLQHADVNHSDDSQTVLGINARRALGNFQLETEATYTRIDGRSLTRVRDKEWGVYVLGSYAIDDRWSVMASMEHFSDRNMAGSARSALLGLSWRPAPALAWKLEYVKQDGARLDIATGVYASFSVLF